MNTGVDITTINKNGQTCRNLAESFNFKEMIELIESHMMIEVDHEQYEVEHNESIDIEKYDQQEDQKTHLNAQRAMLITFKRKLLSQTNDDSDTNMQTNTSKGYTKCTNALDEF